LNRSTRPSWAGFSPIGLAEEFGVDVLDGTLSEDFLSIHAMAEIARWIVGVERLPASFVMR
jgi:hypothetical protein